MAQALLIVDVQNDFIPPHGALAVPQGDRVVERINELANSDAFDLVVATRDWHPPEHGSFRDRGGPWPAHCVRDTPGAQLHPELDASAIDVVVDKGTEPGEEGYSAFDAEELREVLREEQVTGVTITGLAADVCVRHTAHDALRDGLRVTLVSDATRGIDPEGTRKALAELSEAGAVVA